MQLPLARDIAQSVAALVAVGFRVRHFADADAIEYDPDDAAEAHGWVSASAASILSINMATNSSGRNPFMRLETFPCLFSSSVVGIWETCSSRVKPSSK